MITAALIKGKFTDELIHAAKSISEYFSIDKEKDENILGPAKVWDASESEEVAEFLRDPPLPPHVIFDGTFFSYSIFTLHVLVTVAELFSFGKVPDEFTNGLLLTTSEKNDKCISIIAWLSYFICCEV